MKQLPPALQAHLDSGTTTLAWCWRLVRRDGVSLGFTDHDQDLSLDGVTYEAAAGFSASEMKDSVGLAPANLEVTSALSSARLTEGDLAAGRYDNATFQIWRVNWADTDQRILMRAGVLGEVQRTGTSFAVELRGLASALDQPRGRVYQYGCDAVLGDTRCGVDLASPVYRATASVLAVTPLGGLVVSGLGDFAVDWFTRGLATFQSGANAGSAFEIRRHTSVNGQTALELWQPPQRAIVSGDTLMVTAGCDKQHATCRDKFANVVRFRGFPHMPGNDFLATVGRAGDSNDGEALR